MVECPLGEQGKVDESMHEMAAIEALKSEKADKEACCSCFFDPPVLFLGTNINSFSETCNSSLIPREPRVIRSYAFAMCAVPICLC